MCSTSAHPQMLFEKWELFVDDNEAPLPDPFDCSGRSSPELFVDDNEALLSDPFDCSSCSSSSSASEVQEPDPEGKCLSVGVCGLPDGVSVTDFADIVNLTDVIMGVLLVTKLQGKDPPAHIIFNVSPVTAWIIFKKGDLEVDDNEASLPEPFDLIKQCDGREDSGYGTNQAQDGVSSLGKDPNVDVPAVEECEETSGGSIEVQNRKEKRDHRGTKRTGYTSDIGEGEEPRSTRMRQETFANEREDAQAKEALKTEASHRFVFENLSELGQVLPCLGWQGVGPGFRWGLGEVLCRASNFNQLVNELGAPQYDRIGYEGNLQQAIDYANASSSVLDGLDFQIITFPNLRAYFSLQYSQTGDIGDLHQSIKYGQQELAEPQGRDDRAVTLCNLGVSLSSRYGRTQDIDDLHQAIEYGEQALAISQSPSHRAAILTNMTSDWIARYNQTGDIGHLDQSIEYGQQALAEPQGRHRAVTLCNLGVSLRSRYGRTQDIDDLHQTIEYGEQALAISEHSPHRATILSDLCSDLVTRYMQTGAIDDLNQGIEYGHQALAEPQGRDDRAVTLCDLSANLSSRYGRTQDIDDLHQAIEYGEQALAIQPQPHTARATILGNLSSTLVTRYTRTGAIDDLHRSIEYGHRALAEGHDDPAGTLSNLGVSLRFRYWHTGAINDLHEALEYAKQVLAETPQNDRSRADRLNNLGNYLGLRYERTGAIDDLNQAIEYGGQAIKYTQQESGAVQQVLSDSVGLVGNLASYLSLRFEETGDIDDLHRAIEYTQQEATTQDHTGRANCSGTLSMLLYSRYSQIGAIDDLHHAIKYAEQALAASRLQDYIRRHTSLCHMGNYLTQRYKRTGAIDDLRQAIEYGQEVLATIPEGHTDRARCLGNLGGRVHDRYKRTGVMGDLHQSIEYAEQALAATPQGHTGQIRVWNNLGVYLITRYKRTGTTKDLHQAIEYTAQALAATPQGHYGRATCLINLGNYLNTQYDRTGAIDDLRRAIVYAQEALAGTPQGHIGRARCLSHLRSYLHSRYKRTGAMVDLHQAIGYAEQALVATPKSHICQPMFSSNLSISLNARYQQTKAIDDLHQAIEHTEQALAATPHGHPDRPSYLKNLSLGIYSRYQRTQAMGDLHQAIEYTEQALAVTPQAHPFRELHLNEAAMLLFIRFKITKSATDIKNIILLLDESWSLLSSAPSNRVLTALNLFEVFCLLSQCGDPYTSTSSSLLQKSCSILDEAALQLPGVSPRILARQDQQFNLLKFCTIAESTASCALMAGKDAAHALTLLELSRGIIMGFAMDCRGDLSELRITNPKLCDTFTDLRNLIDTPPLNQRNDVIDTSSGDGSFSKAEAHHRETTYAKRKREKAISEMEQTIAKIRKLPGHEKFQLPATPEQLMAMAKDGPIVLFISSYLRSDAIIVTSSAINSITLPELRYDDIPDRLEKITGLTKGKLRNYIARNKTMQEILCWLWNVAVEPVVRALELTVKSAGDPDLAHIWWIGVGDLSMAPFHAAGNYSNPNSHDNILSYAISSYTPTIKALSYAREKDVTLADGNLDSKLLLISMTETPGGGRLPDAAAEVKEIIELTDGSILTRHLDQPNAQTVLDQLKGGLFKAIHFACHGVTDNTDPSGSHLVLLKDGKADKLTVEDISGRSIAGAQLAYLSACSTANNPELRLADETIHIASAFQLAGFNHVVATMWPAESPVCREISKDFYRSLFDGTRVGDGHKKVRIALHGAVKRAQEKYPRSPLKWAPFIHMGA